MPNLDFYAFGDDRRAVLEAVFDLGSFRVFESYSEPDRELREFGSCDEIPGGPPGAHLMLYAAGSGPEPTAHRINLRPGALGDATFRYSCEGWGLIQLYFGILIGRHELRWSHTNHNTQKRAANWASAAADKLGDPARWDFSAVTKASGKLNRAIRAIAVSKISSHPVLPHAAQLIAQAGLQHEYGAGIHANPLGVPLSGSTL